MPGAQSLDDDKVLEWLDCKFLVADIISEVRDQAYNLNSSNPPERQKLKRLWTTDDWEASKSAKSAYNRQLRTW